MRPAVHPHCGADQIRPAVETVNRIQTGFNRFQHQWLRPRRGYVAVAARGSNCTGEVEPNPGTTAALGSDRGGTRWGHDLCPPRTLGRGDVSAAKPCIEIGCHIGVSSHQGKAPGGRRGGGPGNGCHNILDHTLDILDHSSVTPLATESIDTGRSAAVGWLKLIRTLRTVSGDTPTEEATERSEAPGWVRIASATRSRNDALLTGRKRLSRPIRSGMSNC